MTVKIIPVPKSIRKNLTGCTFGQLVVVGYVGQDRQKMSCWLCQCSCGASTVVRGPSLLRKTNPAQSCGCRSRQSMKTHGATGTPEYQAWRNMYQRCTNSNNPQYHLYGGRGIKVCSRWRDSFQNFLQDMGPRPGPGYSIDRIDNDGHYEPQNCRWATPIEQSNNVRRNQRLTANGETHTAAEWARIVGMSKNGLKWRLAHGWTLEEIIHASSNT